MLTLLINESNPLDGLFANSTTGGVGTVPDITVADDGQAVSVQSFTRAGGIITDSFVAGDVLHIGIGDGVNAPVCYVALSSASPATGTMPINTAGMVALFAATAANQISLTLAVVRTRGAHTNTIFSAPIVIRRSAINISTAVPTPSILGAGVAAALQIAINTALGFVRLDASARLPAVDGSQLTNLPNTGGVTSITGTANEITVTGTTTPTLSLPSALTFTGKTVTGGTFASPSLTTPTIGDGTEAAPSLSFTSDTNTGLYRPAADTVGIVGGGNDVVRMTGIASATDYLEIKNGIGVGSPLHVLAEGASANIGVHLQPKGSGLFTISDGTDFNKGIRFRSSSSAASAITLLDAVSTAGRVVTFPDATGTLALVSGDLGTPSALVGTNITGTASGLTAGNATLAATVTVANEATDTTCFPLFATAATGSLAAKSNAGLTFDSATGLLSAPLLRADTVSDNAVTGVSSAGGTGVVGQTVSGYAVSASVSGGGVAFSGFSSSGRLLSLSGADGENFVVANNGQLTLGGFGPSGIIVLNGSTSGSATITVSATGVLALPAGTTATNMTLTTPALGTPSAIVLTNASGTAASLTAGTVTTNANLTGDVTSVGNATTLAAGSASALNSGTLADARLSANVPLKNAANTFTAVNTFTPAARSSGSAAFLTITTPADTAQTASTESIGVNKTAATRQFATGALTTQREVVLAAPTYSFVGASTMTTGVNLDVLQPVAGTNATITGKWAIQTQSMRVNGPAGGTSRIVLNDPDNPTRIGCLLEMSNSGIVKIAGNDTTYGSTGWQYMQVGHNGASTYIDGLTVNLRNSSFTNAVAVNGTTVTIGSGITLAVTTNQTVGGTLAVTGATTLSAALITTPEALAPALDAGAACGVTKVASGFALNGVNALTLANGTNGQIKTIVCTAVTAAGTATLTPTTCSGFTTVAFTAAGQTLTLQYFTTGGWVILSVRGATPA